MKAAIVQVACPASTGNVDFTDSSVTNDLVGAIFFSGNATANDTGAANSSYCIGATDLSGNCCLTYDMRDAATGAAASGLCSTTKAFSRYIAGGGAAGPIAAYGSTLSNGVRMAYSSVTSGVLTSALLISGSDAAMKVGSAQFGTTDTSEVVTHNLGGTPDILIFFVAGNSTGTDVVAQTVSCGFWDRESGTSAGAALRFQSGANPTSGNAFITDTAVGKSLANGSVIATFTLTSVGATTFQLNRANTGLSDFIPWIALRGTQTQMFSKTALISTPTSTGSSTLISGMSGKPQVILTFPTRLQTSNALQTDDTTGSFGIGASCDNAGTTQYASYIGTSQDNIATSVAKNMTSNVTGLGVLDNTGAYTVKSTITSWNSDGATANYSAANASALDLSYLAFGLQSNAIPIAWLTA